MKFIKRFEIEDHEDTVRMLGIGIDYSSSIIGILIWCFSITFKYGKIN